MKRTMLFLLCSLVAACHSESTSIGRYSDKLATTEYRKKYYGCACGPASFHIGAFWPRNQKLGDDSRQLVFECYASRPTSLEVYACDLDDIMIPDVRERIVEFGLLVDVYGWKEVQKRRIKVDSATITRQSTKDAVSFIIRVPGKFMNHPLCLVTYGETGIVVNEYVLGPHHTESTSLSIERVHLPHR